MPKWNVTVKEQKDYWDVEAATEEEAIELVMAGGVLPDEVDDEWFASIVDDDEAEAARTFAPAIQATVEAIKEYRRESEAEESDEEAPLRPVSTSYSPQMMQHIQDQKKLRVVKP